MRCIDCNHYVLDGLLGNKRKDQHMLFAHNGNDGTTVEEVMILLLHRMECTRNSLRSGGGGNNKGIRKIIQHQANALDSLLNYKGIV